MNHREEFWHKEADVSLYLVLNTSRNVTDTDRKLLKKTLKKLHKQLDDAALNAKTAQQALDASMAAQREMTDTTGELRQQLSQLETAVVIEQYRAKSGELIKDVRKYRLADDLVDEIMLKVAAEKQRWELYGRLHQTVELFQTGRISSVVYSAEHARITDDLATLDGVIG